VAVGNLHDFELAFGVKFESRLLSVGSYTKKSADRERKKELFYHCLYIFFAAKIIFLSEKCYNFGKMITFVA
jgi:hypothetical protein